MTNRLAATAKGLCLAVAAALAQDKPFDSLALAQDKPLFSTRVEGVRVDVLVTRQNRPVLGLTAADFELRDNGVPQQIELVGLEQLSLNIVLAFDLSDSVQGARLDELRRASEALLKTLKPDDRSALVTFSHAVTLRCGLSLEVWCVHDALGSIEADGETSLVDGTYIGLIVGESELGRSLLMVFSDRFDTASWLSPERVIETAKRSDVVVYGISAGTGQSRFLRDLSSTTGGRMLEGRTTDLASIFLSILNEFRQRYVLTYTPRGVSNTGWHQLQVRVKRGNPSVKARPGYLTGAQ